MAHVAGHVYTKSRVKQPDEWLAVASAVGDLANKYAERTDLVALVAPGAGNGAPACFIPATAEVEIAQTKEIQVIEDGEVITKEIGLLAGVNPLAVDLTTEEGRLARVALVGAVIHEASHAKHSLWTRPTKEAFPDVTARILDVMTTLEESRIEALMLDGQPVKSRDKTITRDRVAMYLRSCALEVVARDFRIADTRYGSSIGAALTLARVTSGVLDESDVTDIRAAIETVFTADELAALEEVWTEYQKIQTAGLSTEYDSAGVKVSHVKPVRKMIDLAKRWLEIIGIDPEDDADDLAAKIAMVVRGKGEKGEKPEGSGGEKGEKGEGESGDGSGGDGTGDDGDANEGEGGTADGKGAMEKGAPTLADLIKEAAVIVGVETDSEAGEIRREEKHARIVKTRAEDSKREADAREEATKIFSGDHGDGGDAVRTHLRGRRQPTSEERQAAVALARQLERVQYRDRAVTKVTSEAPPGRLRPRGAMARAQQRSRGAIMTAEPWQAKRRKHTDETPLKVGLLTDLSGSMGAASDPMGVLGWVLPEATSRVDAQICSVLFGVKVYGVLKPGQRLQEVMMWSAKDGHEAFTPAFKAVDGSLNLLNGDGARLLVIASDGQFVSSPHAKFADEAMALCRAKGVAVLWLDFSNAPAGRGRPGWHDYYDRCDNHGFGEIVPVATLSSAEIAVEIGKAAVRVLDYVSKVNDR